MVTTMMLGNLSEEQLWSLDTIGITDEAATQSRQDLEAAAVTHFRETVSRLPDGRYECRLPWIEGHRKLLSNKNQSTARLHSVTKALKQENLLEAYDDIFQSWLNDGIIEVAPDEDGDKFEYFLPHRHVLKESSTTPVRRVFDASSKVKGSPSLNECLERRPNLLERIPAVLTRFRLNKFAIVSDIKKAFLQISVHEQDRKVLQFLWWKDTQCNELLVYRHKRVVFGVSSSPFLLAATLQHHLKKEGQQLDAEVAEKLLHSFYVDNSCSSHDTLEQAMDFKDKSTQMLAAAQMDLRGWEYGPSTHEEIVPVLGMLWNTSTDKLSLFLEGTLEKMDGAMTKRGLLSAMNAVFDPMGFAFPFTIVPKFLFQKCCLLELKWDEELPEEIAVPFQKWKDQVPVLAEMWIPRWMGAENVVDISFHVFSDASCVAFACCVFQRTVTAGGSVNVQLMVCRTRVAPAKKKVTIPRLELLGCLIGVRLFQDVKKYLSQPHTRCFYWTDYSTALAWICNDWPWARFVQNRVDEIRKFSSCDEWRHVPGELNPADLPSRGCTAATLMQLQWWEGPEWLRNPEEVWPSSSLMAKEEDVLAEARKTVVSCHVQKVDHVLDDLLKFSNFHTTLRVVVLVLRYMVRLKQRAQQRQRGVVSILEPSLDLLQLTPATAEEIQDAERCVVRFIQSTSFTGAEDEKLKKLPTFLDEYGIIRVKSQLFYGEDNFEARCPAVLPAKNVLVKAIIRTEHQVNSHAGVQTTLALLRNRFWILKGRRTVSGEIGACLQCRRFLAKKCQVPGTPLPRDRITSAAAFEVTGIDLLGPLFLFGGEKVWVVLFTCAVYRCVHLEVTPTLSTEGFMRAFRRFVARRGRPAKVYSDNGLNFVGCSNLFSNLDWEDIRRYAALERMEWIFNPPTAAWWGGFWERLVGLTKNLLRRILGKKVVAMEELCTIMCDVEATLNQRPLTYLSEVDPIMPLTPAMFLQEIGGNGFPEADAADANTLRRSVKRCQSLREQLRIRFRKEYLGQLQHHAGNLSITVKPGDVVIVEHDDKKRLDWPCGVVKTVFPGRDGKGRMAMVKTKDGEFLRPLQRLYILEAALTSDENKESEKVGEKAEAQVPVREKECQSSKEQEVTRSGKKSHAAGLASFLV